jgi:LacI family transcriptional regulator
MATIREVAEKADVSVSTVSHVINETRFVSPDTKSRVLAAMEDLEYEPNRLASSLRRKDKRTHTLGLLIPDSSNPFFAEVLKGVEDASFEAGYSVILCNSDDDPQKEVGYLEVLLSKQIDGVILVSAGDSSESLKLVDRWDGKAVVVDRDIDAPELDSVSVDNEEGGYVATKHLLDHGHKHIGCIGGPSALKPSAGRVKGYKKALDEFGLKLNEANVVSGDFRPQSGYTAAHTILDQDAQVSAIFSTNDMMAVGAIRAINELGKTVPDDISIIGFDDIALASFTTPPLTTIAQPSYEMGMRAAELLVRRFQHPDSEVIREVFKPALVERSSCQARR